MKYNICTIVTVYYPDEQVARNISKLEEQVSSVFITDNTPEQDNSELFRHLNKTVYIPNRENFGLSVAFNKCLKLDALKRSDYILFMDQDSLIPDSLVETLVYNYKYLHDKGYNIGCIGPVYYEKNAKKRMIPKLKKKLENNMYAVSSIITSSMLTTYKNLETINFWNEDIFLDLADWDLCWRFREAHLLCCITQNAVLEHCLGKSAKHFGFFIIKEGAPVREYYQTRDCLKLLIKSYTPMKFRIRFLLMIVIRPFIHLLFLPQKRTRMKYIILGMYDFFGHKKGICRYI